MTRSIRAIRSVAFVLLVGWAVPAWGGADEATEAEVTVLAAAVLTPEPAIQLEVTLTTPDRAQICKANLPWGNLYSVSVVLRDARGKAFCKPQGRIIDDPGPDVETLIRDVPSVGRYRLLPRCPQLATTLTKGPVSADWVYTTPSVAPHGSFKRVRHTGSLRFDRAPGRRTMR